MNAAHGNYRVRKTSFNEDGSVERHTYYFRDNKGNTMGVYEQAPSGPLTLKEQTLYSTNRFGTLYRAENRYAYEVKDHLGNVRAVVNRRVDSAPGIQPELLEEEYPTATRPILAYLADYYPFGWLMPDRKVLEYRYGYQGNEADPETGWTAFQLRMYDGRVGRWMSFDPKKQYASPYLAMGNMPLQMTDPDGGKAVLGDYWAEDGTYLGSDGIDDNRVYVVTAVTGLPQLRLEYFKHSSLNGMDMVQNVTDPSQAGLDLIAEGFTVQDLGIGKDQLLASARWVHGEGGGSFTDAYAHAILNGYDVGPNPSSPRPFNSWQNRFSAGMGSQSFRSFSDGTYNDGNSNYLATNPIRNNASALQRVQGFQKSIASVIGAHAGTTNDPTDGAYLWRGATASNLDKWSSQISVTQTFSANGRYHIFGKSK